MEETNYKESTSYLCKYLNEHFPIEENATDSDSAGPHIESHFWQKFQVYARWEDDYFLFKYAQTLIEQWDPLHVQECRGIIVERCLDSKRWEISSRPFNKFFNQGEGESPVRDDPTFNKICSDFYFVEKADGTCIQVWWDRHLPSANGNGTGNWRISTLGMVTPDTWVPELFWKLVEQEKLKDVLKPEFTYLFELCCEQNRVVTKYDIDKVYLIAVRNKYSGDYITDEDLMINIAKSVSKTEASPLVLPRKFTFKSLGISTLRQTLTWIENEATKESVYGKNPEGFVIYLKGAPLCKLKNNSYLQKHGIVTGDLLYVRNIVIDRFFAESLDDVADVLVQPPIVEFLKELRQKVKDMLHAVEQIRREVILADPNVEIMRQQPKAFVDFLKAKVDGQFSTFFLQYKKESLDPAYDTIEAYFMQWLKKAYTKFRNHWKQTTIAEINEKERQVNWELYPKKSDE